jgi:hypothetical protein
MVFSALSVGAESHKDSVWIKGVVRPDNSHYPFKILKHVSVSLLNHDRTIGKTYSDDSGQFQLRCSRKDLKDSLQLLAEARSSQPVITYDSVCPYIVYKTSDRYFDRYINLTEKMLSNRDVYTEILMNPPLLYINNCMRFNFNSDCANELPCLSRDKDTMCICIGNLYNRLMAQNIVPTVWVRSYYNDHSDSAILRADNVVSQLKTQYNIEAKYIKIEVLNLKDGDAQKLTTLESCNYVQVNLIALKIVSEKDH